MALTLNLTLFVQMAHFIAVYVFITRYFLKPGYEVVKEDEERSHQIRTSIIRYQQTIAERALYKRERWKACQENFIRNRPAFEKELPLMMLPTYEARFSMPAHEEVQKTVREVSILLKERVLRV